MCANYHPSRAELISHYALNSHQAPRYHEVFPGNRAPIVRRSDEATNDLEAVAACFGMVPHWADLKLARHTYNARTETVAQKPSFRNAYKKRQFCIIPAETIYEPNYESGKAVRWGIQRADGQPLSIAGIWEWRPNGGEDYRPLVSFSMLTINADTHPLMNRFHKPGEEKRMVVVLQPHQYDEWLHATPDLAPSFFEQCPADLLVAEAAPRTRSMARPVSTDLFDFGELD